MASTAWVDQSKKFRYQIAEQGKDDRQRSARAARAEVLVHGLNPASISPKLSGPMAIIRLRPMAESIE